MISKETSSYRVNRQIRAPKVRLIDSDGNQLGVVELRDALQRAQELELDLVEISPNASPPVAKILDYGKFRFQQGKKKSVAKKNQKKLKVKEVKFRPGTDIGDYQVKLRNLRSFLESGYKVKITVRFRGREIVHQDLGKDVLDRVIADVTDLAKVEFYPKLEGRQMMMILAPLIAATVAAADSADDDFAE